MIFKVLKGAYRIVKWIWKVGRDVFKRCFYGMASKEVYVRKPNEATWDKVEIGPDEISDLVSKGYRVLSPDPFREGEFYSHNTNSMLGSKPNGYVGDVKIGSKKIRRDVEYDPVFYDDERESDDRIYRIRYEDEYEEEIPDRFIPVDDTQELKKVAMRSILEEHPEYERDLKSIKVDPYAQNVLDDIEFCYSDCLKDSKIYTFKIGNYTTEIIAMELNGGYFVDPADCRVNI